MVEINVTDNMSPVLKTVIAGCQDLRIPLQRSGLYMQKSFALQFKVSGKPRWKPLSWMTIMHRRGFSDKPLIDTGRLMRSYVSRGKDGKWSLSNFQLDIGSNLDYAELHQYGGMSRIQGTDFFKLNKLGKYVKTTEARTRRKGDISKVGDWDEYRDVDINLKTEASERFYRRIKRQAKMGMVNSAWLRTYKARFKRIDYDVTIKVPARPLAIQPEDMINIRTIFERYLYGLFGKQGL